MTKDSALSPHWWRFGLLAPALLLSLGCATSSGSAASSYAHAEAARQAYDSAQDLAEESLSLTDKPLVANWQSQSDASDHGPPEGPPVRTKAGEPSVKLRTGEAALAKDDEQTPKHGRQIVYVAGMQVSVYKLESAIALVEALPDRFGGWVHMRNQSQVVLRLPAAQLKPVMGELAELGVVQARTLQAQDVSAEYVDLDSRITVLRETQTQLLDLLGKAKTVEEALYVRKALDQVTMELELALGRMRQLSDLIAYSTLTVTLVERGPQDHIPTSNDPFGWVDTLGVEATEWR